jgi:replicative DNA helicase
MWQLLVEPEYAEKALPNLAVEYFDDPNLKRLFLIILEYLRTYEKVPNLQNQSIHQAINEFKTPHNVIEEESLFAVVKRIELFNERILNKSLMHDGDVVQKATNEFIKQQEYRKLAEGIIVKTKTGEMKSKKIIGEIEEKFQKIAVIGADEDCGSDVVEGLEKALRREFRETIPTGVEVIDQLTGGGLGKGEMGLILTPSGVGKTTLLTKIANTARENNKNVLQIIFEDTKEQIQRKHVTIWTKIPLSQLDDRNVEALKEFIMI